MVQQKKNDRRGANSSTFNPLDTHVLMYSIAFANVKANY